MIIRVFSCSWYVCKVVSKSKSRSAVKTPSIPSSTLLAFGRLPLGSSSTLTCSLISCLGEPNHQRDLPFPSGRSAGPHTFVARLGRRLAWGLLADFGDVWRGVVFSVAVAHLGEEDTRVEDGQQACGYQDQSGVEDEEALLVLHDVVAPA